MILALQAMRVQHVILALQAIRVQNVILALQAISVRRAASAFVDMDLTVNRGNVPSATAASSTSTILCKMHQRHACRVKQKGKSGTARTSFAQWMMSPHAAFVKPGMSKVRVRHAILALQAMRVQHVMCALQAMQVQHVILALQAIRV